MKKQLHQLYKVITIIIIIILIVPSLFTQSTRAGLTDDLEKQINEKQSQIKELEKKVAELKNSIKDKQQQQTTLKKQIGLLEGQIAELESEIQLIREKINTANLEIQKLNAEISQKENDISAQKEYLTMAIRTINEYDQETPFEMVLKNSSFSDFLNQIQYIETLQEAVQDNLISIKNLKTELEGSRQQQEEFRGKLQVLNIELTGKNLALGFQKDDKEDLLTTTKNQEKKYQTQLQELQRMRQEIQKEIYSLEDKLRLAIDPSSIPKAKRGLLEWPLKNGLTQGYGPTSETGFINNVYSFHNGIDIGASIGDPVRAAYDGTINGVGNDGKYAYGKWVTINHHNGLVTLYGHLSSQKVSNGQKVKRGEVIGYAGSTGFSTGPHLHFTVYAANTFKIESRWYGLLPMGGSINPMNYLE